MSSATATSPSERTELQIRTLLGEIAQHSKRDIPPEEFHAEFLRSVIAALGALGGGLWVLENGTLSLSYQINFKELRLQDSDAEKHTRLLTRMLNSPDTGTLLPPHSGTEGDDEAGNPTEHLLIVCPIRTELETVGLVQIIHRADAPAAIQRNFVQFLAQTCRYATDYYKNRQLRHFGERQNLWVVLEDFTRTIHQNLDPKLTAYTVANEGRRLIGCDRVSVALRNGNSCPISAVSGQDTVNKRATIVRHLGKVAAVVLRAGEPVWYSGSTADFPPQIENAIEKYVDESHSKMIAVYPLVHRKKEGSEEDDKKKRRTPKRPFGVLIVEQLGDSQITEQLRKRVDIVADHASSALGNALEHQSIFLLPLWKLLGKSKRLIAGENLPKTIAVALAVCALMAAMLFLPWKFQMHSTGTLEPGIRHRIYSPLDAEIKQLFVEHNMQVYGPVIGEDGVAYLGARLLELRSPDLEAREIELRGEELRILDHLQSLARQLQNQGGQLSDLDRADLLGQRDRALIQLETVQKRLDFFNRFEKPQLLLTSPIEGVVVTTNLQRRLTPKRPINRTDYVMEIADLEGPWQLELLMPEHRMGYIAKQQQRQPGQPLRVEFLLANAPGVWHTGWVTEIHNRAEVRSDSGSASAMSSAINTVLIKVAFDEETKQKMELRPGTECHARIDCGKRPLGYVIFYELIVYFQKNVWFRWF